MFYILFIFSVYLMRIKSLVFIFIGVWKKKIRWFVYGRKYEKNLFRKCDLNYLVGCIKFY